MKGIKLACLFIAALPSFLASIVYAEPVTSSQKSDSNEKLDRIEKKIDKLSTQSTDSTRINIEQPLGDREQGFEFNFFRLLTLGEDNKSISGTYSFFNTQNNTEIALPFMVSSEKQDSYYGYGLTNQDERLLSITLDAHYRKYLGHRLDGFYISAFARATYLNGLKHQDNYSYNSYSYDSSYQDSALAYKKGSETKLGLGFGIGYRVISDSGYYWGASLSAGKYIFGESDVFLGTYEGTSATLDDEEFIIDIELLKFGFAF